MFGQHSSLNALETRRQLLVTEAEVHRARLRHDLEIIHANAQILGEQAKSVGSVVSTAGLALTAFSAFRGLFGSNHGQKTSLVSKLWSGVRLASSIWLAARSGK